MVVGTGPRGPVPQCAGRMSASRCELSRCTVLDEVAGRTQVEQVAYFTRRSSRRRRHGADVVLEIGGIAGDQRRPAEANCEDFPRIGRDQGVEIEHHLVAEAVAAIGRSGRNGDYRTVAEMGRAGLVEIDSRCRRYEADKTRCHEDSER